MPEDLRLFTIPEVARRLAVAENTVYRRIAAGELRSVNLGTAEYRKTRVRSDDLADYIDRLTTTSKG
jgi:excisionase family DNA binding protein